MKNFPLTFLTLLILGATLFITPAHAAGTKSTNAAIRITTNVGNIDLELYSKQAPKTVKNFLSYVKNKNYDGLIFHRVIPGFMIQGGGYTAKLNEIKSLPPIKNEADNGLKNTAGTIAMARTGDPHSASNQFFINTVDNAFLNHSQKSMKGWGYTVFGKVTKGMDIVKKIESSKTRVYGPFQNLPAPAITILKIRQLKAANKSKSK